MRRLGTEEGRIHNNAKARTDFAGVGGGVDWQATRALRAELTGYVAGVWANLVTGSTFGRARMLRNQRGVHGKRATAVACLAPSCHGQDV